jgi:hypothetical protein
MPGDNMREIHSKLTTIDRKLHDPEIIELIDLIVWKLEEYENRLINLDRVMVDIMTDRKPRI